MNGILLFNKPILWTSHDAVDFVRRRTGLRAVGHAGTLDPLATGLLVLLLGPATKRQNEFMGLDKSYEGVMTLGFSTDTQDCEGRVLAESDFSHVHRETIENVFKKYTGKIRQTPPLFSAVHVKGKKMYEWARHGGGPGAVAAPRPNEREITIHRFELLRLNLPDIYFTLSCSKGTYVRTLVDSIGQDLGCGATLTALVRTRVGSYSLNDALDVS